MQQVIANKDSSLGATTSLPVLDVVVHANVGATTSLAIGQTTCTALGIRAARSRI